METELYTKFKRFLEEIDSEKINTIWEKQSVIFREFWKEKIMDDNAQPITDSEIDEIVLILDKNAKGSHKDTVAVARVMIPQGVWRRLFKEIQSKKELKKLLYNLLMEEDDSNQVKLIDDLYKFNQGQKNSLTGKSGNAINTMLFAFNPQKYLAIISLNDRKKVIDHFGIQCSVDFENDDFGKKIVGSNNSIIEGFRKINIDTSPYLLSKFMYRKLKEEWKPTDDTSTESQEESEKGEEYSESQSSFYMEKELENFLIANWDRTELSKEYELIEEDGNLVSQQYVTGIGKIDILVKEKKTGQYVVIELKRNQTSDETIGQVTRYMGWLEGHKTKGKSTKGIIIASAYDKRLYYALKKVNDVGVYIYQVDFKLNKFREEKEG